MIKIIAILILIAGSYCRTPGKVSSKSSQAEVNHIPTAKVAIETTKTIATLDRNFLSFSIDISLIIGGAWWSGSTKTSHGLGDALAKPLNLTDTKLTRAVTPLLPAILRVGGSTADDVFYDMSGNANLPLPDKYKYKLTASRWDELNNFVSTTGLDFMFTVNAGPGPRHADNRWDDSQIQSLMSYSAKKNYRIKAWELGNEPNAFWLIHGLSSQLSATQYASEFGLFSSIAKSHFPDAMTAGPQSAFWPVLGEPLIGISRITDGFLRDVRPGKLDIVNWHYYPTQSSRCPAGVRYYTPDRLLSKTVLDDVTKITNHIKSLRDKYAPGTPIWLGETGPAQCGGEPGHSDRFQSGLWYLDHLGSLAAADVKIVVRQSLVGSDYGMLDEATLNPRPDYWNALLWKRHMGENVFFVKSTLPDTVRVYSHCTSKSHPRFKPGSITVLVINLSKELRQSILWPDAIESTPKFVTKVTSDAPESKNLFINGHLISDLRNFDFYFAQEQSSEQTILDPLSYQFNVFPDASAPACL